MKMSFSILIQFSFSETITEFPPHLDSLDGFEADKMSMGSRLPFLYGFFSLRMFLMFIFVTNISATLFFSLSLEIQNMTLAFNSLYVYSFVVLTTFI